MRVHARYYYRRMNDEQLQETINNYKSIIEDLREIKPGLVQEVIEYYQVEYFLKNMPDNTVEIAYLYQLVIAKLYDRLLYVEDIEYIS